MAMANVTGAMVIERETDLLCAGFPASAAVAVKPKVPDVVGVPEMMPVAEVKLRPAGRLPEAIDQG